MAYKAAEQVREEHIRAMGPKLGSVYNALTNDVTWLHFKWSQYRQLFAQSEKRIDLLNEAAGFFFRIVQDIFFEDVLLHLTRLTAPVKSYGKSNLTLHCLVQLVPDPELAAEVKTLVDAANGACKSALDWRNRRLAHHDLDLALATAKDPLPGISRADVEAALVAIRTALNRLEGHYWNSEVGYQYSRGEPGNADALVFYLQKGVSAEQAKSERFQEGRPLPEDLVVEDNI
ncbi:MAG: hypothetical protein WC975_11285 [Phycisphaerae bacterium]